MPENHDPLKSPSAKVVTRAIFSRCNTAANRLGQLEMVRQQRQLQGLALQRLRGGADPVEIGAWLDELGEAARKGVQAERASWEASSCAPAASCT